ncbi:glycosyltransferase family 2 protein [Xanthocytophaga agilis]|uniref:Glycosyltransferase n=1 Tax=Xanthocytophaga agilis TaxID=3048010 RepID=A0AAE3UEF8_9BACT|nr:glycosyltransferase [Xanthocytophaga agilis]MDJ1502185.1 glycosyltransferase [Xanthocytophaga agilis]
MSPKVTVVIPNFNHESYLTKRIDSVINQSFQDYEIILMDDKSTDKSHEVIEHYRNHPKVSKIIYNVENSGSTFKQWNKGIKEAKGEYIWIAESDDFNELNFLERMVNLLEADSNRVAAYSHSWEIDSKNVRLRNWDFHYHELNMTLWKSDFVMSGSMLATSYMFIKNIVPNASAVVFKKNAYHKAGGADETYRVIGDWKLWSSLFLQGDVAFVAEPLNYFRTHQRNVRSATARNGISLLERLRVMEYLRTQINIPVDIQDRAMHHFVKTWIDMILQQGLTYQASKKVIQQFIKQDPHAWRRLLKRCWLLRTKMFRLVFKLITN